MMNQPKIPTPLSLCDFAPLRDKNHFLKNLGKNDDDFVLVPVSVSEYVTSPSALVTSDDDAVAPLRPATVTTTVLLDIAPPN